MFELIDVGFFLFLSITVQSINLQVQHKVHLLFANYKPLKAYWSLIILLNCCEFKLVDEGKKTH